MSKMGATAEFNLRERALMGKRKGMTFALFPLHSLSTGMEGPVSGRRRAGCQNGKWPAIPPTFLKLPSVAIQKSAQNLRRHPPFPLAFDGRSPSTRLSPTSLLFSAATTAPNCPLLWPVPIPSSDRNFGSPLPQHRQDQISSHQQQQQQFPSRLPQSLHIPSCECCHIGHSTTAKTKSTASRSPPSYHFAQTMRNPLSVYVHVF